MKVRIKFAKHGLTKFIGHLDIMRYFQKAMRRADVAICYSGGFSPHQIMSFAAPLGVGITSNGEYLDIETEDTENLSTMMERLNQVMAEGIQVTGVFRLPDSAANAMSIVAAADYTLNFREGYEPENPAAWMKDMEEYFRQNHVMVTKKTKKGEKELDLTSLVYEIRGCGETLFLKISTGSSENIKPELVLDAYYRHLGQERPPFAFQVQREEVYAAAPEGAGKPFLTLAELGEPIE